MSKHIHYDMIEKWARTGRQIQYFDGFVWVDITGTPVWDSRTKYRFKPKVIKYKRFIYLDIFDKHRVGCIQEGDNLVNQQNQRCFCEWIDKEIWQEVEIDE